MAEIMQDRHEKRITRSLELSGLEIERLKAQVEGLKREIENMRAYYDSPDTTTEAGDG